VGILYYVLLVHCEIKQKLRSVRFRLIPVENIKKLILIVAKALPSFNKQFTSIFITRISAIIFIYSGALAFNALYIQSIGSGIGIYSGLFEKKIKLRLILLISLFILIRVYVIDIFVSIYLLSFVFIKALKSLWFFF
jgi:hypothetical protein